MEGPSKAGAVLASTLIWLTMCSPIIIGKMANTYRLSSFITLLVPVLAAIYGSTNATIPFFALPWQIMIPVFVILYSTLMLLAELNSSIRGVLGAKEGAKVDWKGILYIFITTLLIILIGMSAYYYTGMREMYGQF